MKVVTDICFLRLSNTHPCALRQKWGKISIPCDCTEEGKQILPVLQLVEVPFQLCSLQHRPSWHQQLKLVQRDLLLHLFRVLICNQCWFQSTQDSFIVAASSRSLSNITGPGRSAAEGSGSEESSAFGRSKTAAIRLAASASSWST